MSSLENALSLDRQVALVTGAAGGIGRATAIALGQAGASIIATDRQEASDELTETVQLIEKLERPVVAITADLATRSAIEELVARARADFDAIDILANVAAIHLFPSPLLEITEEDWDHVHAVNFKSCLALCQLLVPAMVERGSGSIINIASDSAFDVIPDEGAYGISKISLTKLTAYLAKELGGTNVRINAIAPGWVKTQQTEFVWGDPKELEEAVQDIPLRRIADPSEIANVVVFLASRLSSYVNGHCMVVDGGRIAGVPA
jgi:NAD(P)-dependent dehydrogenase (short-subunit alcohol dehydrogenase family)